MKQIVATLGERVPLMANMVEGGKTPPMTATDLEALGFSLVIFPGGLTRALLATNAVKVIAIERDRRFIEALQDVIEASQGRLSIVEADALTVDPEDLAPAPRAIVANLPYNVAVPVLLHLWELLPSLQRTLVMVQAEVADRLAASPGSKVYGIPSVKAAWFADIEPFP